MQAIGSANSVNWLPYDLQFKYFGENRKNALHYPDATW
jgi:hypothetical protein